MNLLILLPLAALIIPVIPLLMELFKRKDKGPRAIPETTLYEEEPNVESETDESEAESIPVMENARLQARVKGTPSAVLRVTGDVSVPDGTTINNNMVVQGRLRLGKKCRVQGSIKAFGGVDIGDGSMVEGHVLSDGTVVIGRNAEVKGMVDSLQDIILKEKAVVGAVSTEKTVKMEPGAKVMRRILSGASIETLETLPPKAVKVPLPPVEAPKPVKPSKPEAAEPQVKVETVPPRVKAAPEKPKRRLKIPFETLNPNVGHLFFYAPTKHGKTFLVKNYIIPYMMMAQKRILVIDPHREYEFKVYEVKYDKTIPDVDSDLFKTFITFNIWADVDRLVKKMIKEISESEENISIRPNIVDSNCERLIISEFLKRITQIRLRKPVLLVVEEADRYDVLSLVTRGRHANIQAVLVSARRLIPEVLSNVHLVLGNVTPSLMKEYDPRAADAASQLNRHEFIWEKDHHEWRMFKLELGAKEIEVPAPEEEAVEESMIPRLVISKPEEARPPLTLIPLAKAPVPEAKTIGKGDIVENIFEDLEKYIERLGRAERGAIDESALKELSQTEAEIYRLVASGYGIDEVSLMLLMDPSEVKTVIDSLIERNYLDKDLRPVKRKVAEAEETSTATEEESSVEFLKESLEKLAEKERPETEAEIEEVEEETDEEESREVQQQGETSTSQALSSEEEEEDISRRLLNFVSLLGNSGK